MARGEGGTVDDRTIGEVVGGVRTLLAAIDAGDMTCSPGYRTRLQGAVVALETLSGGPSNDRMGDQTG